VKHEGRPAERIGRPPFVPPQADACERDHTGEQGKPGTLCVATHCVSHSALGRRAAPGMLDPYVFPVREVCVMTQRCDGFPVRNDQLLTQESSGTLVLFRLDDGQYYALDDVGIRIWGLCDGTRSVPDIVEVIRREYDAPADQIQADVRELLDDLVREGLVVWAEAERRDAGPPE
jgi:hypothetical protein